MKGIRARILRESALCLEAYLHFGFAQDDWAKTVVDHSDN